jgi:EAL and modified HD-GYP domain-containing signal transduction protein
MQDSPLYGQILLGFSPLVDAQRHAYGVQLSVFPARPETTPDAAELLRVLSTAFPVSEDSRRDVQVLLNVASEGMLDLLLDLQPPPRFGIEVPTFLAEDPARAGLLRSLHARGVSLVAKGRSVSAMAPDVLKCFRLIVADADDEVMGLQRPASAGKRPLETILKGVRQPADIDRAFASGIKGVVGWPSEVVSPSGKSGVAPDLRGVVELMNLVERQETVDRMERVLKADPTLAFRLLKFINSAAFGLRVEVTSFKHALMLLGFVRLKRWLALLLASASKDGASRPLLHLAVRRGFLMEGLAVASGQEDLRGEMFICGVFSLLDRLMRQPFSELLDHVPMPARVQVSLLGDGGPYADHLKLLDAIERSAVVDTRDACERLKLSQADVNRALLSALVSARELDV